MRDETDGSDCKNRTQIFSTPEMTRIYRKFSKLRTSLFPYIYTAAHQLPLPITRHHSLHFPRDDEAMNQQYQYMFGSQLLVAPVIYDGARVQDVYLPTNQDWYDIMSNATYDESDGRFRLGFSTLTQGGKTVRVKAPLDACPLFVRAGSIIPTLDPRVFTVNQAQDSHVVTMFDMEHLLYLWIFPTQQQYATSGTLYDKSQFELHSVDAKTVAFQVVADESQRTYILQIVSIRKPSSMTGHDSSSLAYVSDWNQLVGDSAAEGWTFVAGIIWIRTAQRQIMINY